MDPTPPPWWARRLLALLLALDLACSSAESGSHPPVGERLLACEGQSLSIDCAAGELIHVILNLIREQGEVAFTGVIAVCSQISYANYGRTSKTDCTIAHGPAQWNTETCVGAHGEEKIRTE